VAARHLVNDELGKKPRSFKENGNEVINAIIHVKSTKYVKNSGCFLSLNLLSSVDYLKSTMGVKDPCCSEGTFQQRTGHFAASGSKF
jgi:hypothetical protein